jgi:excisionase family DNA binding protein
MSPAEDRVRVAVAELAEALLAVARESAAPARDVSPVELISVAEFARRAGLGRSSAYLAVADGSLRTVKVRGRRLVPASELARLAESAR